MPGARGRLRSVDTNGARLALEHGTAALRITPNRERRWLVEAGPFLVTVKGTVFTVSWDPASERFELALQHGRVVVSGPGGEIALHAGQHLVVSLPKAETVITAEPPGPGRRPRGPAARRQRYRSRPPSHRARRLRVGPRPAARRVRTGRQGRRRSPLGGRARPRILGRHPRRRRSRRRRRDARQRVQRRSVRARGRGPLSTAHRPGPRGAAGAAASLSPLPALARRDLPARARGRAARAGARRRRSSGTTNTWPRRPQAPTRRRRWDGR